MKYKVSKSVSIRKVGDEVFVLNKANKRLHSFNATGGFIWNSLSDGNEVKTVIEQLIEGYDVDTEMAKKDVEDLIAVCERENLLVRE